ncbi:hypothetical protein Baya_10903 [Bagarius yarrelli]|uniref:Uncharacterized protein n=1 Tax=Bagarius yarrelli TaxID=175774 RepID=A0A556V0T6_BAGYA|nr:hypothetical protein Baya_10903 [Bagarius yarrelli]
MNRMNLNIKQVPYYILTEALGRDGDPNNTLGEDREQSKVLVGAKRRIWPLNGAMVLDVARQRRQVFDRCLSMAISDVIVRPDVLDILVAQSDICSPAQFSN